MSLPTQPIGFLEENGQWQKSALDALYDAALLWLAEIGRF